MAIVRCQYSANILGLLLLLCSCVPSSWAEEVGLRTPFRLVDLLNRNNVMLQTMHTLLQQTTYIDEDMRSSDEMQPISCIVTKVALEFLMEHCVLFMNGGTLSSVTPPKPMPKYIPILLEAWMHRRSESSRKNIEAFPLLLAQFLLTSLHFYIIRWCDVVPRIHLHQLFHENGIEFSNVLQLLLACIVATEPSQVNGVTFEALRTTAWSFVGCMLTEFGCASFLVAAEEATSRLGEARPLCTVLRLAVGEYKIQWTLRLGQEEKDELRKPDVAPPTLRPLAEVTALSALPQWTILESCAESIVAAVQFLTELADQMDDDIPYKNAQLAGVGEEGSKGTKIPPDAILHMQQSIQEALLVAMQCLIHAGPLARDTSDAPNHLRNAIRIVAVVISELDVFPISTWNVAAVSLKMSRAKDDATTTSMEQQVQAVYAAMTHRVVWYSYKDDVELHGLVVLCVLKVLATAEGDSDLLSLLHENGILGESLVSFIDRCFRCYMNMGQFSSVLDLCEIMELSVRLGERNSNASPQYQSFIVKYLQHRLSRLDRLNARPLSKETANALHALVDCYLSLHSEADVPVSHASTLRMVLELGSGICWNL
jgi:hypothetical protein